MLVIIISNEVIFFSEMKLIKFEEIGGKLIIMIIVLIWVRD